MSISSLPDFSGRHARAKRGSPIRVASIPAFGTGTDSCPATISGGLPIPPRVIEAIIEARKQYQESGSLSAERETAFWNAYGLLRSSIEPSTRARRRYRWVFYCALVLLLGVQLYYVFGSSVHSEATRLEKEYLDVQAQRIAAQDPDNKTPPAVPVEILGQQEGVIWGELSAHNDLSEILIDVWSYPFSAFLANYEPGGAQDEWAKYIETKSSLATLKVILDFLAA